jgi:hypothetical protein
MREVVLLLPKRFGVADVQRAGCYAREVDAARMLRRLLEVGLAVKAGDKYEARDALCDGRVVNRNPAFADAVEDAATAEDAALAWHWGRYSEAHRERLVKPKWAPADVVILGDLVGIETDAPGAPALIIPRSAGKSAAVLVGAPVDAAGNATSWTARKRLDLAVYGRGGIVRPCQWSGRLLAVTYEAAKGKGDVNPYHRHAFDAPQPLIGERDGWMYVDRADNGHRITRWGVKG